MKEECERRNAQLDIALNTLKGEKAASDRIIKQLSEDIQRFSSNQSTTQKDIINENTQLK